MTDFEEELFVKFWYNTTFFQTKDGMMAMSYEDFKELSNICNEIIEGRRLPV